MLLFIFVILILLFLRVHTYERFSNQDQLIQTFNDNGCIIVPNVLNNKDCNSILNIIREEERSKDTQYGNINSAHKRKDLMLSLKKMISKGSPAQTTMWMRSGSIFWFS